MIDLFVSVIKHGSCDDAITRNRLGSISLKQLGLEGWSQRQSSLMRLP